MMVLINLCLQAIEQVSNTPGQYQTVVEKRPEIQRKKATFAALLQGCREREQRKEVCSENQNPNMCLTV